jgi:hypothetical protein
MNAPDEPSSAAERLRKRRESLKKNSKPISTQSEAPEGQTQTGEGAEPENQKASEVKKRRMRFEEFNWEKVKFPVPERKPPEPIEFNWEPLREDQDPLVSKMKETAESKSAETEPLDEIPMTARTREAIEIFLDDTFNLKLAPEDEALFAFNKKNEEFQELLDEEYEKLRRRQIKSDNVESRINEDIMTPEVPTPESLISDPDPKRTADERIYAFLRRSDQEMDDALQARTTRIDMGKDRYRQE